MRDDGERLIRATRQEKRVLSHDPLNHAAERQRAWVIEGVDRRSSNVRRRRGLRRDECSMPQHPQAIAKIARARQMGVQLLTSFVIDQRIQAQRSRAPDGIRALVSSQLISSYRRAESVGGSIENRGIDVVHVGARDRDLGGDCCDTPPAPSPRTATSCVGCVDLAGAPEPRLRAASVRGPSFRGLDHGAGPALRQVSSSCPGPRIPRHDPRQARRAKARSNH